MCVWRGGGGGGGGGYGSTGSIDCNTELCTGDHGIARQVE